MASNVWAAMGFNDDLQVTLFQINRDNVVAWKETEDFEYLVAYPDPSGSTVGLFEHEDTGPLETFSLRNPTVATVEAFQVKPGLVAVDVLDRGNELFTRLLIMVDDPQMYPLYPLNEVGNLARFENYQLGAVAQDVAVYDSVGEWREQTEPIDHAGTRPGPRFCASPWLFALYAGDASPEEASSVSMFVGICEEVETVTNQLTGRQWYRI